MSMLSSALTDYKRNFVRSWWTKESDSFLMICNVMLFAP